MPMASSSLEMASTTISDSDGGHAPAPFCGKYQASVEAPAVAVDEAVFTTQAVDAALAVPPQIPARRRVFRRGYSDCRR
jgi:hypothetical protein